MLDICESSLYKKIKSDAFIYKAIYSVENSINEKYLLSDSDLRLLKMISDPFNEEIINNLIEDVKRKIDEILINDESFTSSVYFRPKKIDKDEVVNRPLHTSDLHTIITSIVFLNAIILDVKDKDYEINEVAKMLPENFYGNIPTVEPNRIFKHWSSQYREYINNATKKFNEFRETKEFRFEVTLDLIDFFPSINPIIIYNELISKVILENMIDYVCFKKVLIKLLTFKVTNLSSEELIYYYGSNEINRHSKFVKGLPQGLPHSYFFGNICMIKVSEIFLRHLNGVSFFYVDDSIIYTNSLINVEDLEQKIQLINRDLEAYCNSYKEVSRFDEKNEYSDFENVFLSSFNDFIFKISVHNDESVKSFAIDIHDSGMKPKALIEYSKLASITSNDINKLFSDLEESNLANRLEALYKNIENEIKNKKNNPSSNESSYLKLLIRYKKFFKYRQTYLKQRENEDQKNKNFEEFKKKIELSDDKYDEFFVYYNEDILPFEIDYYYNAFIQDREILKKNMLFLSQSMYKYNIENTYFYKYIHSLEFQRDKLDFEDYDIYDSIKIMIRKSMFLSKKPSKEIKDQRIRELLIALNFMSNSINSDSCKYEGELYLLLKKLGVFKETESRFKFIISKTEEITRMIVNAYLSEAIQVETSDKIIFYKFEIKPILNKEARLLFYIRNRYFKISDFLQRFNDYLLLDKDDFDYSILNVIEYFEKHLKYPNMIDDLVLIHKYTSDIWKNGSKFLHFYTLHNHEHAMELIKSIILFKRSTSYFQISNYDYYILFISCYLHDISMVLHPNLITEFVKDRSSSDVLLSEFKDSIAQILKIDENFKYQNQLNNIDEKVVKKILVDYFIKLDQFYENKVRNNHANDSANFILESNDLNFIDSTIRDIVAEVGRGHGYLTEEIYNAKSKSKDHLINEKYMKILLRIGDLMDVSSNRITNVIFNNNQKNMSNTTRFHWLSHRAISNINIKVEYEEATKQFMGNQENKIRENIYFEINIKNSHFINIEKNVNCTHVPKFNLSRNTDRKSNILFEIDSVESNQCHKCNFMCKWMLSKNEYLHLELLALKKYIDNLNENIFDSKFYINYIIEENAQKLNNSDFLSISNYIQN